MKLRIVLGGVLAALVSLPALTQSLSGSSGTTSRVRQPAREEIKKDTPQSSAGHPVKPGETETNNDGVTVHVPPTADKCVNLTPLHGTTNSATTVDCPNDAVCTVSGTDANDTVKVTSGCDVTISGTGGTVTVNGSGATANVTCDPGGGQITVTGPGGTTVTVTAGNTATVST